MKCVQLQLIHQNISMVSSTLYINENVFFVQGERMKMLMPVYDIKIEQISSFYDKIKV